MTPIDNSNAKPRRGGDTVGGAVELGAIGGGSAFACQAAPRGEDRHRRGQAHEAQQRGRRSPRHHRDEPSGRGRQRHLAEIAGEIVAGECGARALAGKGARDEVGGDRMLHARPDAADHQRYGQHCKPGAGAGREIADAGKRRAERQQRRPAQPFGEEARRHLKARHRPGIERAQDADLRIAEAKFRLPQREQHIEEIGKTVMQRMRTARHRHCAPLRNPGKAAGDGRYQRQRAILHPANRAAEDRGVARAGLQLFPFMTASLVCRSTPD